MRFLFVFFLTLLFCSCIISKDIKKKKKGKIILDGSDKGVFIPKNRKENDIINLTYTVQNDSISLQSIYKSGFVKSKVKYSIGENSKDSLNVILHALGTCPTGFVIVDFFNSNDSIVFSYSPLGGEKKLNIDDSFTKFQLNVLGAKSSFFTLPSNIKGLNIYFDHPSVSELNRYTEIDTTLYFHFIPERKVFKYSSEKLK